MYTKKLISKERNLPIKQQKKRQGNYLSDNRCIETSGLNNMQRKKNNVGKSWFVEDSLIHGQGIMAGKSLSKEEKLGKVASLHQDKGLDITSDFGSLINHQSNKRANASLEKEGTNFFLKTNKAVQEGEEITTDYDTAGPYFAKSKSSYKDM